MKVRTRCPCCNGSGGLPNLLFTLSNDELAELAKHSREEILAMFEDGRLDKTKRRCPHCDQNGMIQYEVIKNREIF